MYIPKMFFAYHRLPRGVQTCKILIFNALWYYVSGLGGYQQGYHVTTTFNKILTILYVHCTMPVEILQTDTAREMALKIYNDFIVMQSCLVLGVVIDENNRLHEKGRSVIEWIKNMDEIDNCTGKGRRSKKTFGENSIGGFKADKAFKWRRTIHNEEIRYNIWRVQ